jgi:predicted anti-sigma-YlaC factor YlaD
METTVATAATVVAAGTGTVTATAAIERAIVPDVTLSRRMRRRHPAHAPLIET